MDSLFSRATKEIEALQEIKNGFVPLFKLAPRYAKKASSGVAGSPQGGAVAPADVCAKTDALVKQLSTLARTHSWESRSVLFNLIAQQRRLEEVEESKSMHELTVMDVEDWIILWTNHLLGHGAAAQTKTKATTAATPTAAGAATAITPSSSLNSPSAAAPVKEKRKLRDLSTDLRDSTLYMQLLQVLGPELPTQKVEKLVRAKGRWRTETRRCESNG